MILFFEQWQFMLDVLKLINQIEFLGFRATFGETYRTKEQQEIYVKEGKSKTMDSAHLNRLAIDINFFKHNIKNDTWKLTYLKEDLQLIGDYWESLNDKNSWGGNWEFLDTPHFQRNI